jgi:hypothetical protein
MGIKILRLVTGEDVIGEVSVDDADGYVVNKPALIGMVNDPSGNPSMALQRYLPHSEEGDDVAIRIGSSHVIFSFAPLAEIVEHYGKAFSGSEGDVIS